MSHDMLSTFPDPVEEALHRASRGDLAGARNIITPLVREIQASGSSPSPELQALLEKLVIDDAATHGVC